MDDEDAKIDLSALDPSRDPERWQRMLGAVLARRPSPLGLTLLGWARPALAAAAVVVMAVWGVALTRGGGRAVAETREAPGFALARWAQAGELPPTAQLLETLGGGDAAR